MIYRSGEESLEGKTCKFVAKFTRENRDIDWLIARYERMRDRWSALVHCGDGSRASGSLISDAVAEANAAVRVLASKGVRDKRIKEIR